MYDYGIFFLMTSLPKQVIANHRFYYELCKLQIRNSFNVPLQSTMFDLNLDVSFWKKAQAIQSGKEQLARQVLRDTGTSVYHNRYYSDFETWITQNPKWKALTDSMLFDSNSILASRFLDRAEMTAKVSAHRKGLGTHSREIIKWISLEIFLRQIEQN